MKSKVKKLFNKERDSLNRSVSEVIIQLNASLGGSWTYDKDNDRYEDMKSNAERESYEIKLK